MANRITCPECRAIYERVPVQFLERDRGDFECAACRRVLDSWDGTSVPLYRLIKRTDQRGIFAPMDGATAR